MERPCPGEASAAGAPLRGSSRPETPSLTLSGAGCGLQRPGELTHEAARLALSPPLPPPGSHALPGAQGLAQRRCHSSDRCRACTHAPLLPRQPHLHRPPGQPSLTFPGRHVARSLTPPDKAPSQPALLCPLNTLVPYPLPAVFLCVTLDRTHSRPAASRAQNTSAQRAPKPCHPRE